MTDSKREELIEATARAILDAAETPESARDEQVWGWARRDALAALDVFESQPAPAVSGLDLDALEAVARAATPGPWHQGAHYIGAGGEPHDPEVQVGQASVIPDAKHMAAFDPPTVLALIAAARPAPVEGDERERLARIVMEHLECAMESDNDDTGSFSYCETHDWGSAVDDGAACPYAGRLADSVLAAGFHLTGEPEWTESVQYGHLLSGGIFMVEAKGINYATHERRVRLGTPKWIEHYPVNQEGTGR